LNRFAPALRRLRTVLAISLAALGLSFGGSGARAGASTTIARPPADPLSLDVAIEHLAELGGGASAVAVDAHYAYVGIGGYLVTIDVGDPATPRAVRSDELSAIAEGIAVKSGWAYVALGQDGMHVIDVTDPTVAPRSIISASDPAWDIALADRYAYVVAGAAVQVLDVSDPARPLKVANVALPAAAQRVVVAGGYAYVVADGLRVLDVRDPTAPKVVATYDVTTLDVAVAGHYGYVATGTGELQIIDLTDPTAPAQVGSVALDGESTTTVVVAGGLAYVGLGDDGLAIVEVAAPATPRVLSTLAGYPSPSSGHSGSRIAVAGGLAYVAAWESGLRIVDTTDLAAPREVGAFGEGFHASDVRIAGDYAYIAAFSGGLRVVDIGEPSAPRLVGALSGTPLNELFVADGYAYGADCCHLYVIDVTDPTQPRLVGQSEPLAGWPTEIVVEAGYAYVAAAYGGLQIFDVHVSSEPRLVSQFEVTALAVQLAGTHALVLDGRALQVIDVADPTTPRSAVTLKLPGWGWHLRLASHFAYVADEAYGLLEVVDISDPTQPVLVSTYQGHPVSELAVEDGAVYLVGGGQLRVIDVRVPTALRERRTYDHVRDCDAVVSRSGVVYLAMWTRGLVVLRVGAPPPPVPPNTLYLPSVQRSAS
jgi:hypothetical protein